MLHAGSSLVIILEMCGVCEEEHFRQRPVHIYTSRGEIRNLQRLPHSGNFIFAYSQEGLTHVASSLRLRKASCLQKRERCFEGTFKKLLVLLRVCCALRWVLWQQQLFFCAVGLRASQNFPKE
jgi:hypothetical protein